MPANIQDITQSDFAAWPARNTVDPLRRPWMSAHAMILLAASTVLVSMRLHVRSRGVAGRFGLDDALLLAAWVFSAALSTVAVIQSSRFQLDRHIWDVNPENWVACALCAWIAQLFFHVSSCSTKCSVLLFYRRTFREVGHYRAWLYASYAALGITIGYSAVTLVIYFCLCTPLEAYWRTYGLDYHAPHQCLSGRAVSLWIGAGSVTSDLIAVSLPYFALRRQALSVDKSRRIGLHFIFTLGLVVAAAGGVRTFYLWELARNVDTSWTGFDLFVWSLVECHLAIVVASVPSARTFVRRHILHRGQPTGIEEPDESGSVKGGTAGRSTGARRKDFWSLASNEPLRINEDGVRI